MPASCSPVFFYAVFRHETPRDAARQPLHLQVVLARHTLLYSYSRFVYESVTGCIIGDIVIIFPFSGVCDRRGLHHALLLVLRDSCFPVELVWLYLSNG